MRLCEAFMAWGFRVAVACATAPTKCNGHAAGLERRGITVHHLPLNSASASSSVLQEVEPSVVVFDRFYMEEAHSFRVRALRPSVLRILDMQDSHAWRLSRQRAVERGADIEEAVRALPNAEDASLAREISAIQRSDLTFVCSPVEERWLRDVCAVAPHKLALAPLFAGAQAPPSDDRLDPARFADRGGFVSLGTFRHRPNMDACNFLVREIWPQIRAALPDAQLDLLGSHPTPVANALHSSAEGVNVIGHVTPSQLARRLTGARALLAPLRFGAGLKGKVVEAWAHGTPVVTTPIGAEGMTSVATTPIVSKGSTSEPECERGGQWGGLWTATTAASFAADAVRMHSDAALWGTCARRGADLRLALFDERPLLHRLHEAVERALDSCRERRANDFVGAALWHHRSRSTEFFARWLEAKAVIEQQGGLARSSPVDT